MLDQARVATILAEIIYGAIATKKDSSKGLNANKYREMTPVKLSDISIALQWSGRVSHRLEHSMQIGARCENGTKTSKDNSLSQNPVEVVGRMDLTIDLGKRSDYSEWF